MKRPHLAVRWTVGDVSARGFEALRLSIWGTTRVFGADATYTVCVNSLSAEDARQRTGPIPAGVLWHDATEEMPDFIKPYLDASLADGTAWKLSPLRLFPESWELSLDNDCILWDMPTAIRRWLSEGDRTRCVIAEDVRAGFGRFNHLCGTHPMNAGIRGLPAGFDYAKALREVLVENPVVLSSELDEQGLQVAAISRLASPHVVGIEEVTLCSPFPPNLPDLGRCGAHFVGLNVKSLPWTHEGRPAVDVIHAHWERWKAELHDRVGAPLGM